MRLENEYWILTKQDAENYAKTAVVNSECARYFNKDQPIFPYDYCLKHAKKQLKRNLSLSEKELKIMTLNKLIVFQERRFHRDQMIQNIFVKQEKWFEHLGSLGKKNKIFKSENAALREQIRKQAEAISAR